MLGFVKNFARILGRPIKRIRCDNAGKNQELERECKKEGMGIFFEYTAPDSPQQNGRVKREFVTLSGRMRAMLTGSGFQTWLQKFLWADILFPQNRFRTRFLEECCFGCYARCAPLTHKGSSHAHAVSHVSTLVGAYRRVATRAARP